MSSAEYETDDYYPSSSDCASHSDDSNFNSDSPKRRKTEKKNTTASRLQAPTKSSSAHQKTSTAPRSAGMRSRRKAANKRAKRWACDMICDSDSSSSSEDEEVVATNNAKNARSKCLDDEDDERSGVEKEEVSDNGDKIKITDDDDDDSAKNRVSRTNSRLKITKSSRKIADSDGSLDSACHGGRKRPKPKTLSRNGPVAGGGLSDSDSASDFSAGFKPRSRPRRNGAKTGASEHDSSDQVDSDDMQIDRGNVSKTDTAKGNKSKINENKSNKVKATKNKSDARKVAKDNSSRAPLRRNAVRRTRSAALAATYQEESSTAPNSSDEEERVKATTRTTVTKVATKSKSPPEVLDLMSSDDDDIIEIIPSPRSSLNTTRSPLNKSPSLSTTRSSFNTTRLSFDTRLSPNTRSSFNTTRPSLDSKMSSTEIDSLNDEISFPPPKSEMPTDGLHPTACPEERVPNPSVRADSNRALEKARQAREDLLRAQRYHAEDVEVELSPVQQTTLCRVVRAESSDDSVHLPVVTSVPKPVTYSGKNISLSLRYKTPQSKKVLNSILKIRMDEPLQILLDRFRAHHVSWLLPTSDVVFNFDGEEMALNKTPACYDMEEDDLIDVTIKENASRNNGNGKKLAATTEFVVIHVRRKGGTPSNHHTFQIRKTDPFSKLVASYCKQYCLPFIVLEYNGRALDPNQSPQSEGVVSNVFLDAVVKGENGSSSTGDVAIRSGGGLCISVKFRVNGDSNDVITLSLQSQSTFQRSLVRFAEKRKVPLENCRFIFDGETLSPMNTPENLDLEGDEIVDVTVMENAMVPAPSRKAKARSGLAVKQDICIQTNRNRNKGVRQKQWHLANTSTLFELKQQYIKAYKSRGCRRVQFYFHNDLIQDESKMLRDLGISDGDIIYAMENGRKYIPV